MISVAWKEMKFFKLRYALIGFILFFVAALIFIVSGLANGLSMDNASALKSMEGDAFYLETDAEGRIDRSALVVPDAIQKKLPDSVETLRLQMATVLTEKEKKVDVTFFGIDPNGFLAPDVTEGMVPASSAQAVADQSVKRLGIDIGDRVTDKRTGTEVEITGFTKHQTYSHTPVLFVAPATFNEIAFSEGTNLLVARSLTDTDRNEIKAAISGGEWVDSKEILKGIPGFEAEQSSLSMMLGFLLVIAAFILGAFFYIMTIQKLNQFGILKAIGTTNRFLVGATLLQVAILSTIGITAAFGLTFGMIQLLPDNVPFRFDLPTFLTYAGILFSVSMLGALLSCFNIVKSDPIQAMGRVE